jgi:hypothetical protein
VLNERIQELKHQAGVDRNPDQEGLDQFAELIVRECSRIADDWVNNEDNGKNYPSDKMKQHFGVEE